MDGVTVEIHLVSPSMVKNATKCQHLVSRWKFSYKKTPTFVIGY